MKRFYSFLATMVLMIMAATSVSAKDYFTTSEEPVTEIEDGMVVVIKGSFKNQWASDAGNTATVSSDCQFKLIKVGTANGYAIWNVQHVNTGKYLKGGELTSDPTAATKFHIERAVGYETYDECVNDPIHGVENDCHGTPVEWEGSFIFVNSESTGTVLGMYYDGLSFWGYRDTAAMYLYTAGPASGRTRAELMMADLFPENKMPNEIFTSGDQIGQVPAEYYDVLQAAYDVMDNLLHDGNDHSEADFDQAADALEAAYNACTENIVEVTPGYYRFRTTREGYATGYAYSNGNITNWVSGTYEIPETLTADDAAYIWEFTKAPDTKGGYYIRSLRENKYIDFVDEGNASQTLSEEPTSVWYIETSPTVSNTFVFRAGTNMGQGLHAAVANSYLVRWNYTSMESSWYIEQVDANDIAALEEPVKQAQINDRLAAAFGEAVTEYEAGNARLPIEKIWSGEDVWTNAQETAEPNTEVANAVDTNEDGTPNYGTFFHSSWSNPGIAKSHNFCADLDDAYSTVRIQITDRANANTYNRPTLVDLYGANEIAEGDSLAGDSWHYAGRFAVRYSATDTVMFNGASLGVGNVTAYFDTPYRYIRMDVIQTTNKSGENYKYFTASNISFASELDAENSLNETIPAEYTAPLKEALKKATAEIGSGAATQATIDELKDALKRYTDSFPNAETLTTLLNDVKAITENISSEYDAPGYFDASYDVSSIRGSLEELEEVFNVGGKISYADFQQYMTQLRGFIKDVNTAVKRPEAGLYRISSHSDNNKIFGSMAYAATAGECGMRWDNTATNVDFKNDLRGIWEMNVNEDNTVTLRNLFSGYYMGTAAGKDLSAGIPMSKEPVNIEIQYSGIPGTFNLVQEEGRYMNADPRGVLVTWYERAGNSTFEFSDESNNSWEGMHIMTVEANCPNIITLPFSIVNDPFGAAFVEVLGFNREKGTLELNDVATDNIAAGTPFIVIPEEGTDVYFTPTDVMTIEDARDIEYTDKATTANGLVGALSPVTLEKRELKFTTLNEEPIISYLDAKSEIEATKGYLTLDGLAEITESGKYSIKFHENVLSGVQSIIVDNAAKKQAVYDLSGRRVQKLRKGLYIVNGKKVLVK